MLDQDVTMLQLAASLMDPNDFMINLLNKFALVVWSNKEFDCAEDDSIRQTTTIVEEFFSLLIMIVGERFVFSIIMYFLCISKTLVGQANNDVQSKFVFDNENSLFYSENLSFLITKFVVCPSSGPSEPI
jgi:hypothetical protein